MKIWPWGARNHMTGFWESFRHIYYVVEGEKGADYSFKMYGPLRSSDWRHGLSGCEIRGIQLSAFWHTIKSMVEFWWEEFRK